MPRSSARRQPGRRPARATALFVVVGLGLAACSSGATSSAAGGASSAATSAATSGTPTETTSAAGSTSAAPAASGGNIKIAYLQKQGDQQYFVDEANGAKSVAGTDNFGLTVADLGTSADTAISQVQAAIAQKVSGIIIVPPDPSVGPQIIQLAKAANIPIISSDDQVCSTGPDPTKCAAGDLLPRVGFSGEQMGTQVGQKAGELFKAAGWTADNTKILSEWQESVTVCGDRVKAAQTAFETASGIKASVITVGTDNSVAGAQSKTAATLNANHDVKHWVVWGCNDENVQGAVTALQNGGVNAADIIGVGLGAYLACKDWAKGAAPSGMKAALFIDGNSIGKTAVQLMYDHLTNGKAFPQEVAAPTKMVDPTDWQTSGLKCT